MGKCLRFKGEVRGSNCEGRIARLEGRSSIYEGSKLFLTQRAQRAQSLYTIKYHACAGGVANYATTRERRGGCER